MNRISLVIAMNLLAGLLSLSGGGEEVLRDGWRFQLGPGERGVEAAGYDDGEWRELELPHDWAIEGSFDAEGGGGTGRLPWRNEGWYRRKFTLPAGNGASRVYLDFDGVMAFPKVYINGQLAGEWDYGYTSFRVDATPFIRWGEENVVAVHVDTRDWGSRWYPGAGIYRKVTLVTEAAVHLSHWGIQVQTNGDELAGIPVDEAIVRTEIDNFADAATEVHLEQVILDPDGSEVGRNVARLEISAGGRVTAEQHLKVPDPLLWDIEHPHLYTLRTSLRVEGRTVDEETTRFGFRTFAFTADDGFHLNGRRVQLKGFNNHHDLGPLGGAFNRRAAERQLEIMQEMGGNALRTAHNPPAPEVLDLCDEMGILVWDEVFDKYTWTAGRADMQPSLPAFSKRHISSTVMRDVNHPSIIVWSTGNEVNPDEQGEGITPERVSMMAEFVRELDLSRPVAQGCHIPGLVDGQNFAALDLTGWNYSRRYANYRAQYPDKPIIYSESASALSTRGYYNPEFPDRPSDYDASFQLSSYDLTAAYWSDVPDVEFRLMEQDSFVAGEFVWTGFDYLGEPTPFDAEARSSYFGIVDLCGFPKDRYYLYRSHWREDVPTVHILPHWNWPDRVGETVPVFVYTNGDSAELFLNGQSLGRRYKGQVPPRSRNLAPQSLVQASSAVEGHPAEAMLDGDLDQAWQAEPGDAEPYCIIDLKQQQTVAQVMVDTVNKENDYAYTIEGSIDGQVWNQIVEHSMRRIPRWSGPTRAFHRLEPMNIRFLRLTFLGAQRDAPPGLREIMIFEKWEDNDYFDITYSYRLRWDAVRYEPGQLRAVAYKDGLSIGEATVETTGAPVALRLTPDCTQLDTASRDLAFITVEAVDAEGRACPIADNLVHFDVGGAGIIKAVGNGNPLSFELFKADRRHLFSGKALLIIQSLRGSSGEISITASSMGLKPASLTLNTE